MFVILFWRFPRLEYEIYYIDEWDLSEFDFYRKMRINIIQLIIQYVLTNKITENNGLNMLYTVINDNISILKFKEITNLHYIKWIRIKCFLLK